MDKRLATKAQTAPRGARLAIDPAELGAHAETAAALLRAMSSKSRLLVLCNLVEGERSVGELQRIVGLSQSALSQHLAVLRRIETGRDAPRNADDLLPPRRRRGFGGARDAPRHLLRALGGRQIAPPLSRRVRRVLVQLLAHRHNRAVNDIVWPRRFAAHALAAASASAPPTTRWLTRVPSSMIAAGSAGRGADRPPPRCRHPSRKAE